MATRRYTTRSGNRHHAIGGKRAGRAFASARAPRRGQRGLTLLELIVFIIVVSVGLVGTLSVLNITARKSEDPVVRKQVIAAAEAMLEEVLLKDFANATCLPSCVANSQADRPNYTSVDNYNGWNQTGVVDILGNAVPGLGTYTVRVVVTSTALGAIAATDSKSITVTVNGSGEQIALTGFRTNYSP